MLTQLALLALSGTALAASSYPEPTITLGSGPDPPSFTGPAPTGSWAPTGSVVASGTTYAPPSMTGTGKQAQINSAQDFCLYFPPDPTTQNLVEAEALAVSYCFNPFNDTRPMPDGFITSAHYRETPDYVQVSGSFNWAKLGLNPYDCGGEYDNHGAQGLGNPIGAHIDGGDNWMQFAGSCDTGAGDSLFCIRSCHGDNSYPYCRNTFDLMGCLWVMPGDYLEDGFTNCQADSDLPVGVYNSSYTFSQGMTPTPLPVGAPSSSMCTTVASPTPSGVQYSFQMQAYDTGSFITAGASSTASSSRSASGTGAASSAPASGAASLALNIGAVVGAGVLGVGVLVGGVMVW